MLLLSPPPPPPPPPPFSFTSHNIYYITLITRHCHANNLPSTEQAVKIKPKQDVWGGFL